jgi:hypothetical protein
MNMLVVLIEIIKIVLLWNEQFSCRELNFLIYEYNLVLYVEKSLLCYHQKFNVIILRLVYTKLS